MRATELEQLLRQAPFEPFIIHMSDGSNYTVLHPDQVVLTRRAAYIGVRSVARSRVFQDVVIADLTHITRLAPSTSGRRTRRKRAG